MKKMTAALFTAAAMGFSGFAIADDHASGPDISGRVQFTYTDKANSGGDSKSSSRLDFSGSGEGINGLSTGYFARLSLKEDGNSGMDYGVVSLGGSAGTLSVGFDDDLVYKYVGARTDLARGQSDGFRAASAKGFTATGSASVQFNGGVDALSFGVFADTSGNHGAERLQVAAALDLGMGSIGVAYSDRDTASSEEIFFGGTLDLDVISFNATVGQNEDRTNPVAIAAQAPLNDVFTFALGYSDTNTGHDTTAVLVANLGGGLSSHIDYQTGDSEDGVSVGIRFAF